MSSSMQQFKAIAWKQWLLKRRGGVTTLVEVLSPVLVISVLVLAYSLVDPEPRPARIRVEDTERTIRELRHDLSQWADSALPEGCQDLLQNFTTSAGDFDQASLPGTSLAAGTQQAVADCLAKASSGAGGLTSIILRTAQKFIDRNGPLPILTLDEFILLHEVVQAAAQANPGGIRLLRNVQSTIGRNLLGNLIDLGQVAFAPATPDVLRFADYMVKQHSLFSKHFYGVFGTEAEGEAYARTASPRLWALVVFHSGPNSAGSDVTIRQNYTALPSASQAINKHSHGVPRGNKRYFTSGFLSLQAAIEGYSLNQGQPGSAGAREGQIGTIPRNGSTQDGLKFTAWASVFPTAPYTKNDFYGAVGPLLGMLVGMSLLFPLAQLVRGVVEEKESRTEETMQIMGLRGYISPLVWALSYWIEFFIIAALTTAICCSSFFHSTSPSLLFTVLLLFTTSELAFGMMIASFFESAKISAITAPLIHFAFLMPRYIFIRTEEQQALAGKTAIGLFSPSAFTFASDLFGAYEAGGQGLGWKDLWDDGFPIGAVMLLLYFDTLLYSLLAWYFKAVLPSQYGSNRPWNFVFRPSYWTGLYSSVRTTRAPLGQEEEEALVEEGRSSSSEAAVVMKGLRKVYGEKVAVKDMSLTMHTGITALLGHNGAGKSSAVSMMTGLTTPTSGDVEIMGCSIVSQQQAARRNLGYCPQANVLFGRLTVEEHLVIYAAIKGIPGGLFSQASHCAAEEAMQLVELGEKRSTPARALSGGMKRRLQVAIALLGDSKVVLLDEPTSGVDPVSRRALWEVLLKRKAHSAIMLVTHFIDEADILADQVAIMVEGEIACSGSSWQLKQQYSNGYTLQMTMEVEGHTQDPSPLVALVKAQVPGAVFVRSAAAEVSMRLPMPSTHLFANLLDELEASKGRLGLASFSISMPSLEEAFLEAGNAVAKKAEAADGALPSDGHVCATQGRALGEAHVANAEAVKETVSIAAGDVDAEQPSVTFLSFCGIALVEMVKKRFITSVRDRKTVLWSLVLPVLAIALVMCILQINIDPSSPEMALDLASLQTAPLSALNLPPPLATCNSSSLYTPPDSACRGSLSFRQRSSTRGDSIDLNSFLLSDILSGRPAQYAAVVFDDPVLRRITPGNDTLPVGSLSWGAVAGALASAAGLQNGSTYSQAAGQGAALLFLLSKEFQVLQTMQRRFAELPPVNLMHNASAQHALPSLLSGMHRTVGALQSEGGAGPKFAARSHPLPLSVQESIELDSILLVLAALFLLCPFCLLSGAFTMAPVAERVTGSQQIQLLYCPAVVYWAGSYLWDMATHLLVCMAALTIFAAFGDEATVGSPSQALGTFLALFLFGAAVIPFCYCLSMAFASPSAAQVATAAVNFLLGFCAVNGSYVMTVIPKTVALQKVLVHFFRINPSFLLGEALIEMTRYHFLSSISQAAEQSDAPAPASNSTSPLQSLAAAFQALGLSNSTASPSPTPSADPQNQGLGMLSEGGIYSWGVLGRPITLMILEAALFCCLVVLIDQYKRRLSLPWPLHRLPDVIVLGKVRLRKWRMGAKGGGSEQRGYHGVQADPDIEMTDQEGLEAASGGEVDLEVGPQGAVEDAVVVAERQRVDSSPPGRDAITISHLRKEYPGHPPKVALQDLCLAIRHGERCGILGKNGAGKTTCLSVLTRQIPPSGGDVLVHGRSISAPDTHAAGAARQLGYCPQIDPLLDMMSAREQLRMYARLKGVPPARLQAAVREVLQRVSLPDEMSRRPSVQYSGGSKRKLALAIALVGGVSAVLLDEPSSGMDPGARRKMWQFIVASTEGQGSGGQPGSAVSTVLTTHSMEECEALCSRIAILHQGRLLCLGSPSQLKSTYGSGFILEVHADESSGAGIIDFVTSALGGQLKEARIGSGRFVLSKPGQSMSEVFRTLEQAKARLGIHEYGLSQPSLEQVFLNVVGSQ